MERRKTFYDLTRSLSSGFFSDEVIIMLNRLKKTNKLLNADKGILDQAVSFFDEILEGYKCSDDPIFSEQSVKNSTSFDQVTTIFSTYSSESFKKYIKELKRIATDIKKNRFDKKKIEKLDDFFFRYSKFALKQTDSIINRAPISITL